MDEPSRQVSSRHKREKRKPRKEREILFFSDRKLNMYKSEHGKQYGPGLVHPKKQKVFKIPCHIESCGTCMKH